MFHNSQGGNLDTNLEYYFELSFVMAEVGHLHGKLGVTLCIFYNDSGGQFLIKL